ncbi:MAG: hypothetical protein IH987_07245 [Planctomycetes bacterium]|nr:hypothetical protein [Planctomycetota bacterium]
MQLLPSSLAQEYGFSPAEKRSGLVAATRTTMRRRLTAPNPAAVALVEVTVCRCLVTLLIWKSPSARILAQANLSERTNSSPPFQENVRVFKNLVSIQDHASAQRAWPFCELLGMLPEPNSLAPDHWPWYKTLPHIDK